MTDHNLLDEDCRTTPEILALVELAKAVLEEVHPEHGGVKTTLDTVGF